MAAINNVASSPNMTQLLQASQTAKAYKQNGIQAAQQANQKQGAGEAYDVNISDAAKNAQAAAGGQKDVSSLGYASTGQSADAKAADGNTETKGITADQLRALQEQTDQSYSMMIQAMTEQNMHIQGLFNEGIYDFRGSDGSLFSLSNFVLPPVGTTPEEAQAAISEGGDYSVEAVSDRIFGLASAIAGNDPKMLEEMRAAVEEGFKQAGAAFKDITGKSEMPQITQDTYSHIMDRFDKRAADLGGNA